MAAQRQPHHPSHFDGQEYASSQYLTSGSLSHSEFPSPRHYASKDGTHPSRPTAPPPKTTTGIVSEHGHSLDQIEPMSVHSGSSVVTFFTGLFQTILAISTLGASITFSYVLSNSSPNSNGDSQISSPTSPHARFSTATIQLFLSISWLLFLLNLAFASLGSTLLTFFKDHWKDDWDCKHGKTSHLTVQWYAVLASAVMGGLVIGAFILLCLVVVAYSPVVGWIALGFTTFFGFIILVSIGWQVPLTTVRSRKMVSVRAATA